MRYRCTERMVHGYTDWRAIYPTRLTRWYRFRCWLRERGYKLRAWVHGGSWLREWLVYVTIPVLLAATTLAVTVELLF